MHVMVMRSIVTRNNLLLVDRRRCSSKFEGNLATLSLQKFASTVHVDL
jgi:hypothetical protein